jgi:transposase
MDIESIYNDLIDGLSYRQIALKYKVKLSTLHDFVSKPEHSARAKSALEISAQTYADQAEQVLLDIQPDSTPIEMARARELSQYYKWKAAKRNPRGFSDKLDLTTDGEKIQQQAIFVVDERAKQKFASDESDIDK